MRLLFNYTGSKLLFCFFHLEFHSAIQHGCTYVVKELIQYVNLNRVEKHKDLEEELKKLRLINGK